MAPIDIRSEFPILDHCIFMNHAGVAPIPARTSRVLQAWAEEAQTKVGSDWPRWARSVPACRSQAARLLGCAPEEIALIHNTTHGLLIVANSIRFRPGDNVLIAEHEFPANIYPWKNLIARGVGHRAVAERDGRFLLDDFAAMIDHRTRLISVSLVQYSTGFRMPIEALAEICRERGILLCVDGIQALGCMPVDVKALGCDFFAADGHKWLLSPEGLGVLYVRREIMDRLTDAMTGWIGREHPGDYDNTEQPLVATAKRFEEGSHAISLAIGLEQSASLLLEVGASEVWNRIESLTARIEERARELGLRIISPRGENERSGIVALERPGTNPKQWLPKLQERGIYVAARRNWLRLSPHFYNQSEQVDELFAALREII